MANVKIAILGAGAYGTALGLVLTGGVPGIRAGRSRTVTLWTDDAEVSREIRERRLNSRHLAGVTLPRALAATTDLTEALTGAEIIVFTLPSQAVRQVATLVGSLLIDPQASPPDGAGAGGEPPLFIGAANGLEEISRLRMSQVIAAELPEPHRPRILALSGPALARDLCRGAPTAVVLACHELPLAREVRRRIQTPILKIQVSRDVAGVELGGMLKNAYSLALGMCDGLGLGLNTKAAIVTRALAEMTRLGVALGGRRATFHGLAGLGDLLGTGLSSDSRNRRAGEDLALRPETVETSGADPGVVEGIGAVRSALAIAAERRIRLPLLEGIGGVLDQQIEPLKMILRMVG